MVNKDWAPCRRRPGVCPRVDSSSDWSAAERGGRGSHHVLATPLSNIEADHPMHRRQSSYSRRASRYTSEKITTGSLPDRSNRVAITRVLLKRAHLRT